MSTKITYNGKTTELANGSIATLPCKDFKMASNLMIEAPSASEGGGVAIAEWNGETAYKPDDIVIFDKVYYVCIKATVAGAVVNNPSVTPTEWKRLNGAYKGKYDSNTIYYFGDIVVSNNNLYQSKIDNPETAPDNDMANRWTLLYEGEGGRQNYCLVRWYNDDRTTLLYEIIVPYGTSAVYAGETPVSTKSEENVTYIFDGFSPSTANITEDTDCYAVYEEIRRVGLDSVSWEQISAYSQEGIAENYFAVGDKKLIMLNGTVGTLELDNTALYVYILGFDHNTEITGDTGITFGTFKTIDGIDVALKDSKSGSTYEGIKWFNMNHWNNYNYGGWSACDLRYDILGSTDVPPSDYGGSKKVSSVGYDATTNCTSNPVPDTLMSALPADLRAVMKPMTVYTDNVGNKSNEEVNVTATIDYLPLLAEFEVFGVRTKANEFEQNKQKQYDYYSVGNSKKKYKHSNGTTAVQWNGRSPAISTNLSFARVNANGDTYVSMDVGGLAPIFLV